MCRMQTRHPHTGKSINLLRTDTQIARDGRVLLWVTDDIEPSIRWSRWGTLFTDPSSYSRLCSHDIHPTIIILRTVDDVSGWLPILERHDPHKTETLIFGSAGLLAKIKRPNTICLDDLSEAYPFLGGVSDTLENLVVAIAHVLRFNRLVWTSEKSASDQMLAAWKRHCKADLVVLPRGACADDHVPQSWLIQQYFKHNLPKRSREIWKCLEQNLACPYIDRILLLNEELYDDIPENPKIIQKKIGHVLTYSDALQAVRTYLPVGAMAIISNSDIWFDETLREIWSLRIRERRLFLALLRWEETGKLTPRADSQDAWILAKDCVDFDVTAEEFDIPFGKPGCDNCIPVSMLRNRFVIANPAYTIRCHHEHGSRIRNYDPRDFVYRPTFMHVEPTAIQPFHAATDLSAFEDKRFSISTTGRSFPRELRSVNQAHCDLACAAMSGEKEIFDANSSNIWNPIDVGRRPIYVIRNGGFMTPDGLVSTFDTLLIGQHEGWRDGWMTTTVSTLTPAIHVPSVVSVSCPTGCWTSITDWILYYLPTALSVRQNVKTNKGEPIPEFLVPSVPEISDFLYDCVWSETHMSVVPYIEDGQYYAETIYAVAPSKDVNAMRVSTDDIAVLRSLLKPPRHEQSSNAKPCIVFCLGHDDDLCTKAWMEETCECIFIHPDKWHIIGLAADAGVEKRREALQSADWIIGEGNALDWMWMATKPGVRVLELMKETAISPVRLHLAGACGIPYIMSLVRKEPIEYQREHALLDIGKAIQTYGLREVIETTPAAFQKRPTIVIPCEQNGIWHRESEGFREMAEIWAERGMCLLRRSNRTPYCWWADVGDVLLYDYPTLRWWPIDSVPSYRMALFGNCSPPGPANHLYKQSLWSYWPRSPRVLEEHLKKDGVLPWESRTTTTVFLGRLDNGSQIRHRTQQDWSVSVEDFMMSASTVRTANLTQQDYLSRISKAKYGLCLPGTGLKSSREIEYMACGTVPIIAGKCNIAGYLCAPVEGVHYFQISGPDEIAKIVEETSPQQWTRMSHACRQWWTENASPEGLFRLTLRRIESVRPFLQMATTL
jgi:hypothetical protein